MIDDRARQRDDLVSWASSAAARKAATSLLKRYGLPRGKDQIHDVLAEVTTSVLVRIDREPLDLRDSAPVAAYARTSLANAAADIARGHHEASLEDLMDQGLLQPAADEAPPPDDDPAGQFGPDLATVLARALHAVLRPPSHRPTWTVAAALAFVALNDDWVCAASDIRTPDAQHGGAADPIRWAALDYAGQDRCFAQPETGAIRQRRSAAIAQLDRTLTAAVDLLPVSEQAR